MALEKFTLGSLAEIDNGRIREAFEQAMRRCQFDCEDRPGVDTPRKLNLTMTMVPVQTEDGRLISCNVQFQIKDNLPERKSRAFNMKVDHDGLLFNELSPGNARQMTLDGAPLADGPTETSTPEKNAG